MKPELLEIINLEHHVSENHPQMSRSARAAQFAPFAALRGLEDERAFVEKAQLAVERRELSEESVFELEEQFQKVRKGSHIAAHYFCAGHYETIEGNVILFDSIERRIRIKNDSVDKVIAFDDIDEIVVRE